MYKDSVKGLEECSSHNEILSVITQQVTLILDKDKEENDGQRSSKCENLENSYMFFISKISCKGGQVIQIEQELYQ